MGGHTGAQSSGFRVRMAFLQGFGKVQAAFRHNALRDFLHGRRAHGGAVRGFRVRMDFLQSFGKSQADSRRNAPRGRPFGCPLLCGLPAAYRGEAQKNTVSRQFRDTAF